MEVPEAAITDTSTIDDGTSVRVICSASPSSARAIDASAARLSLVPFGAPPTETAEAEPTDQRARKLGKREPPSLSVDGSSEARLRAEVDQSGGDWADHNGGVVDAVGWLSELRGAMVETWERRFDGDSAVLAVLW